MDNVTHSLAGLVLAEAAVQLRVRLTRSEPSRRFRAGAAAWSLVAANLPDADLFYTGVGGDPLAYMLHHRGYTHTVAIALLGAMLLWVSAVRAWPWRAGQPAEGDDAHWLLGLLLVSGASHLLLDWTNSYGVHPFWPASDRWFYGDAVFIVEPWLWVVSAPMLVAATSNRVARVLLSLVLLIGLALSWRVPLVSTGAAVALTAGAMAAIALARALRPGGRAAAAVGGWLVVTLAMMAGAAVARHSVASSARTADQSAELLDVVVSPLPANAVCMSVITVERSKGSYRVVTARASAAPWLTAAGRCGEPRATSPIFTASARRSTPAVHWDSEWSADAGDLATLARRNCRAMAALRFIRVPVWRAIDDSTLMLWDARYGGASGRGFASVTVSRRAPRCPGTVPPWTPPRADVLGRLTASRL